MRFSVFSRTSDNAACHRGAVSALALVCVALWSLPVLAESEGGFIKKRKKLQQEQQQAATAPAFGSEQTGTGRKRPLKSQEPLSQPAQTNWNNGVSGGKATTETEVVIDKGVQPLLSVGSAAAMHSAIARYESIAASGGWGTIAASKLNKGDQGKEVTALKRRLVAEGYLPPSTLEGEKGVTFTNAVEQALKQFQINHGLAATGKLDKTTVAALNIPVGRRLSALRANLPRVAEYSKDLGQRYIIVNIPALQLEAVENGRVFSRHNIIAGKPERPSPIVMTSLSDINFNPYWNVPVSIVERDLIPQMLKGGTQVIRKQNIRIFDGYQGPEVDPDDVDWRSTPADRYFFRQDPGKDNAMATVKINFPSPFGVYMHDTPLRSLFSSAARYQSSGCVRIDKVPILVNWILNGQDGWHPGRIASMADSVERLDVKLTNPPQIRWVYLTAWASSTGQVNFRDDIYQLDGTGFVVGQPMPVGEYSDDGQRWVLKPVPRSPAASPVDSLGDDGWFFFDSPSPKKKTESAQKPKPGSTLGVTTIQPAPSAKKKATATPAAAKTAAKASGNSAFDKARTKADIRKGNAMVEEEETPPKIVKKKKKPADTTKVAAKKPAPDEEPLFGQD